MDLTAFQYDRSFVLDALRHGELDYLEHVSEAADADLFRHLIRRQIIQRLAETYPSPRKKEEVPVWISCPAKSVSSARRPGLSRLPAHAPFRWFDRGKIGRASCRERVSLSVVARG